MRNHQLESRVRENRTHGSEGGESVVLFPTPISPLIFLGSRIRGNDGIEQLCAS